VCHTKLNKNGSFFHELAVRTVMVASDHGAALFAKGNMGSEIWGQVYV